LLVSSKLCASYDPHYGLDITTTQSKSLCNNLNSYINCYCDLQHCDLLSFNLFSLFFTSWIKWFGTKWKHDQVDNFCTLSQKSQVVIKLFIYCIQIFKLIYSMINTRISFSYNYFEESTCVYLHGISTLNKWVVSKSIF